MAVETIKSNSGVYTGEAANGRVKRRIRRKFWI